MVPDVTKSLRGFRSRWWVEAHELELGRNNDSQREQWNKTNPDIQNPHFGATKAQEEWKDIERATDDTYRSQLVHLLSDADALRMALRNKLPKEAQMPEDNAAAASFAQALADGSAVQSGLNCCPDSIKKAADYLDSLAKRVARIETLKS